MSSSSLILPVLAASLVGSLHCAGMCGPIVAFYSGGDTTEGRKRWLAHVAYHAGRGTAYVVLGGVAGALGAAVDFAGAAAGIGRIAASLAGVVMIVWGLALLVEVGGFRIPHIGMPGWMQGRLVEILRGLRGKPPVVRALVIGSATAVMPCGWLYAFAVTAAATGEVIGGALVMGAFWLGTVPMLLGIGIGVQTLASKIRRHVPVLAALILIGMGLYAVLGRLSIPAFAGRLMSDEASPSRTTPPGHEPCCH